MKWLRRLRKAFSTKPWKKYICVTDVSGNEIWMKRRKGKCPLYMIAVDPATEGEDRSARVLLRLDNGLGLVVMGVEYSEEE